MGYIDADIRAAEQRDARDLESLGALWDIVLAAHQAVCRIPAPRHPERRWDVRDLLDALSGALTDIAAEQERIRNSPVVVESSYDPDLALQDLLERRRLDRAP